MRGFALRLCHSQSSHKYRKTEHKGEPNVKLGTSTPESVNSVIDITVIPDGKFRMPTPKSVNSVADITTTKDVPQLFGEILKELSVCKQEFGGVRNFSNHPCITHKVKQKDFTNTFTDYEYIYLTVLGFSALQQHCEEIVSQNNGQDFTKNPGTRMLEQLCGMTMHGNREGSNVLLRTAPATLIEAFAMAKRSNGFQTFFREAFDRCSDPCLEGRLEKLMLYLETRVSCGESGTPPWEEVSLKPLLPTATAQDVIGDHLRVFRNECTWLWSCERGLKYDAAKEAQLQDSSAADFMRFYNAATFEHALRVRGVVVEDNAVQWEVQTENGEWQKYERGAHAQIREAQKQGLSKLNLKLGPRGWTYELNLQTRMQRNPKTGKERPMRSVCACRRETGTVSPDDMRSAIAFFVEMVTLPAAPNPDVQNHEVYIYV